MRYIRHAERSIFGFSYLPIDIIFYTGLFVAIISFFVIIAYFIYLIFTKGSINLTYLLLFAIFIFGGIQLISISMVGKYVQVILEEAKQRPVYIAREIIKNGKIKNAKYK